MNSIHPNRQVVLRHSAQEHLSVLLTPSDVLSCLQGNGCSRYSLRMIES